MRLLSFLSSCVHLFHGLHSIHTFCAAKLKYVENVILQKLSPSRCGLMVDVDEDVSICLCAGRWVEWRRRRRWRRMRILSGICCWAANAFADAVRSIVVVSAL